MLEYATMATEAVRQQRRKERVKDNFRYLAGTATHPIKTVRERRESGLPSLGSRGRNKFFNTGLAGVLEVPAKIDEKNKKSLVTSLGSLLMVSGVLKGDADLVNRGYELVEADVVYTTKTPKSRPADYGLMVPAPNRVSNQSALSVEAVMAMRDIFDYKNPQGFTDSLNGYNLLAIIINDVDALVDRGLIGQAQMRETFDVALRRLSTVAGIPSAVIAPFILADLLNSEPSQAAEWLRNIPPQMLRPALDALVGSAIGYQVGKVQDKNSIDPTYKNRIVKTILGAIGGGIAGTAVEALGEDALKSANDVIAATSLTSAAVVKAAESVYFSPKRKIKASFENGITWLKDNEAAVIPFLSAVFHQQGRRRLELYAEQMGAGKTEALKRFTTQVTVEHLMSLGMTQADVARMVNAMIANDRELENTSLRPVRNLVSSSYARTLMLSGMVESLRMIRHDNKNPQGYELMPVISPAHIRDYVYTHGAAMRDGIDLAKAQKPTLALSILYPSMWVNNLLDFFHPTTNPQKNEKNLKDAVNFAGRYENSGGTGIRLMSSFAFWGEIWPQIVSANQFNDFYSIVADNLNDKNADGMRSNFSLVVQPNPMQEMLNALSVFYIDFSLPEYHGSSQRGAVKHIDSMITNLVGQIDSNPRALMDLLSFVSYSKAVIMSKPYFQKLGYNVEVDKGRFFLDTSVRNMEMVVNRTIKILFDKYLSNPRGLLLGFKDELASGKMTPERVNAIYMEMTALMEWTLREVPEFYRTPEGREVFRKLDSDIYERAGVYSPGNVFSAAYVDIFYNVIKVMNEHKKKENWDNGDERAVVLDEYAKLADKSLFVMLRNTLKVNVNPIHQANIDAKGITDYLTQNYGFFEFALNFASNESVLALVVVLRGILGTVADQAVEFASEELDQTRQSPERRKIRLLLTSITPRVITELSERGLTQEINSLAMAGKDAAEKINTEEAKKRRAGSKII